MRGPSRIDLSQPAAAPSYSFTRPPIQTRNDTTTLPVAAPQKKRVLFVCIGNSCRSQMAEAFAKAYGSDVMIASSAGISPATLISPLTGQTLKERGIEMEDHFPKALDIMPRDGFDLMINMSGAMIFWTASEQMNWSVADPIGRSEEFYREIANQVESLVMRLILELRNAP
jgi:arsenate reductase (thioredoxin)